MNFRSLKILITVFIFFFQTFDSKVYGHKSKKVLERIKTTEYRKIKNNNFKQDFFAEIKWEKHNSEPTKNYQNWIKYDGVINKTIFLDKSKSKYIPNAYQINSLNRSLVFDNRIIGPDASWLVPPGFKWSSSYKFDGSLRGHNRRTGNEPFFGWNGGDAVGQFYYQPIHHKNFSLGLNIGIRSVYKGDADGGKTPFGEGQSLGFRADYSLSETSGLALGAEQLLHFDNKTDTGRDIYLTLSKGWWRDNKYGGFPLDIATFGFATGKMAEGNIKGLCSDLLGGSGTEISYQRPLCWSPVFSLARVFNSKFSSFFEYNSKWFLVGSSISPFDNIPIRGTFAVQLSDHIDNYKINSLDELKWVFRLSLGF